VRDEKAKVLVRPLIQHSEPAVVRAQYAEGGATDGKTVPGYRSEPDVPPSSTTSRSPRCVSIDNWRWTGVPFYLRSGKRMEK